MALSCHFAYDGGRSGARGGTGGHPDSVAPGAGDGYAGQPLHSRLDVGDTIEVSGRILGKSAVPALDEGRGGRGVDAGDRSEISHGLLDQEIVGQGQRFFVAEPPERGP